MSESLTAEGYEQTKRKLARLKERLARIDEMNELSESHRTEVRRSYETMMRQYRREIKLYEAETAQETSAR